MSLERNSHEAIGAAVEAGLTIVVTAEQIRGLLAAPQRDPRLEAAEVTDRGGLLTIGPISQS